MSCGVAGIESWVFVDDTARGRIDRGAL